MAAVRRRRGAKKPRPPLPLPVLAALCLSAFGVQAQTPAWVPLDGPVPSGLGGAFDLRRGRMVRPFDAEGVLEGAGGRWLRVPVAADPTLRPVARSGHAMAFDSRRGRLVLFSGTTNNSLLSDTWAWDGLRWTRLQSAATPPRRLGGAMAYDARRDVMVLVGGRDLPTLPLPMHFTDTWELVGDQWRPFAGTFLYGPFAVLGYHEARGEMVLVANGAAVFDGTAWRPGDPTVVTGRPAATAYDAARQVLVLCAEDGRIREYGAGGTWTDRGIVAPAGLDAAHFDPAPGVVLLSASAGVRQMAWDGVRLTGPPRELPLWGNSPFQWFGSFADPARGELVVVANDAAGQTVTWTHSGRTWTAHRGGGHPTVLRAALTYDPGRVTGLLFAESGQFWSWDGSTWSPLPGGPPARSYAHFVFDTVRGRAVLTGGISSTGVLRDLWEWDGTAWSQRATNGPVLHVLGALAFDPLRGRTVAFDSSGTPTQTHEWDGSQWQAMPVTTPPAWGGIRMTWDPAAGAVLLVAPSGQWLYDGTAWAVRAGPGIAGRAGHGLHVHPTRGSLVSVDAQGVLELLPAVPADPAPRGSPCGLPPAVLMTDRRAAIGDPGFRLEAAVAPGAPVLFALAATPADLPLGNGCRLLVGQVFALQTVAASARGLCALPLPIPDLPALLGLDVFAQAAALLAGQPGGFVTTQGLHLPIVR